MSFLAGSVDARLSETHLTADENIRKRMIRDILFSMFQAIDARKWHRLSDYFNEDVIYIRPGYPEIHGLEALRKFYAEIRVIASGVHQIERVYYDAEDIRAVNVIGCFHGLDRQGQQLAVRFCDAYLFAGEKITLRESYFNSPAV